MSDSIDHPKHYNYSQVEPIDVIEAWGLGFHLGNCLKYISRAGHKGNAEEDLKKARWYLDREIARRQSATASQTRQTSAAQSPAAPAWQSFAGRSDAHG